mgnify:CR=1 FL=1
MYALGLILSVSVAYIFGNVVNAIISKPELLPTRPVNIAFPSLSPSATPTPPPRANNPSNKQIECVGPDGVHFKTTQQACDDLNNFWKNPNQPRPTVVDDGWERKVEGKTTWSWVPRDDHMSTADELFEAINNYRKAQNLPTVERNDTLCSIAQNRANELLTFGKLDDHAGFEKYARGQHEFGTMDEIIQGGVMPLSGVHLVEYGWDRSLTGHRDALQDRTLTHGCSGIAGYFAVFIFSSR